MWLYIVDIILLLIALLIIGLGVMKRIKWMDVILLVASLMCIMIGLRSFDYWIFMISIIFMLIVKIRTSK